MNPRAIITVPRKEFTGWFLAVRAYREAGLSDVVLTFSQGGLHLLGYWGETRMPYQGAFTGRVRIPAKRMLTVARKTEKMLSQPLPVTLKLYPERKCLGVDLIEVPAVFEPTDETPPLKPMSAHAATAVGLTIPAGELLQLIHKASPGRRGTKDTVKLIASASGLAVQTARGHASQAAFILGEGSWILSLDVMIQALQSYAPATPLTVEADANGMRINSFKMPVLAWEGRVG